MENSGLPIENLDWKQIGHYTKFMAAGETNAIAVLNSDNNGIYYNIADRGWAYVYHQDVKTIAFSESALYAIRADNTLWRWEGPKVGVGTSWVKVFGGQALQVAMFRADNDIAIVNNEGILENISPDMPNPHMADNVKLIYDGGFYLDNNNNFYMWNPGHDEMDPSSDFQLMASNVAEATTNVGNVFYKDTSGNIFYYEGGWNQIATEKTNYTNLVGADYGKLFCLDEHGNILMYNNSHASWMQVGNGARQLAVNNNKVYALKGKDVFSAPSDFT